MCRWSRSGAHPYRVALDRLVDWAWATLGAQPADHGKNADSFPNALATMWCYITDDRAEAERILSERVIPTVHRPEHTTPGRRGLER